MMPRFQSDKEKDANNLVLFFRKAVHATVVLLPLFGLHWLLTLYRPQDGSNCVWQTFYKYLNLFLDGLQGLMVSIAFCYRNGEVSVSALNVTGRSQHDECRRFYNCPPLDVMYRLHNHRNEITSYEIAD